MWTKRIVSFRSSAILTIGLLLNLVFANNNNNNHTFDGGRNECPCLPAAVVRNATIDWEVAGAELGHAVWDTFGIDCGAEHGMTSNVDVCVGNRDPGSWCATEWCYVDHKRCQLTHTRSTIYPSLSYSFATCGNPDHFVRDPKSLRGHRFRAVLIDNHRGYQGTICPPDGEDGECEGTIVDFAKLLEERGSEMNISAEYLPSLPDWVTQKANNYSLFQENNENMANAACVYGTSLSAIDLCVGAFTKNEHRSMLSSFLEMGTTREYLIVYDDGSNSMTFTEGIKGVFAPFSLSLWLLTVLVLFLLSVLFVLQERSSWSALTEGKTMAVAAYYAILSFFDQGRSFDQGWEIYNADDDGLTWGGRLTLLALAVQILLTGASYTANLTNFLVKDALSPSINSIDEVINANIPLCVLRNKISVLDMTFGKGRINYATHPVDGEEGFPDREELLEGMDDNRCRAAVLGMENLDTEHSKGRHCQKHAVGTPVIELPWGIPVSDRYAPALKTVVSHLQQNGDWSKIERKHKPDSACHTDNDDDDHETERLRPINMLGSYVMSGVLAILGICSSCVRVSKKRSLGRSSARTRPQTKEDYHGGDDIIVEEEEAAVVESSTLEANGDSLSSLRGNVGSTGSTLRGRAGGLLRMKNNSSSSSNNNNNNNNNNDSGSSFIHRNSNRTHTELATLRDEIADLKQTVIDLKQVVVFEQHHASSSYK